MATNNPWQNYAVVGEEESSPTPGAPQGASPWSQYETVSPPGLGSEILEGTVEGVKGVGRIAGRSAASLVAAPAKGIGGILELLSQFGTEGEPGQVKGAGTRLLRNVGQYLQKTGKGGEKYLKDQIENALGKSYTSFEESLAGFGERVADIYGRGPFKGMALPAAVGGASGQIAEELGASEGTQAIAELAGIFGPDGAKAAVSLIPKALKEKSGLILPKIVEKTKEGFKAIAPKVFQGKKEKVYQGVSDQAKTLINKIQREKMPLTKKLEEGIDVEGILNKQLDEVQKIAGEMPHQIESNYLSDYLKKVKKDIRKSPVPTEEQDKILKLVEKYQKSYGQTEGGLRFYSPQEYLKQFRNINKDAKKLYETKLLQGEQRETIGFYEGLKKEISKTFELGTPKEFSDLFKATNKEFSELSNINRFETVMEGVTSNGVIDASKLSKKISSQKGSRLLRRQLGKEGFDHLKAISDDLVKVKDKLKLVDELGLGSLVKSAVAAGVLSKLGVPFAKTAQGGKKLLELGQGYMLMNPRGFRDTQNFLKALQSGSKKSIQTYLRRLDKHALEYQKENPSVYPYEQSAEPEKKTS
jgi:hypothetical protein